MPALPDPTPDIFHDAAARIVHDVLAKTPALGRRGHPSDELIDTLGDILEELFVRVLDTALTGALGIAPTDPVTTTPLAVWDVVRDLRTRLTRVESETEERLTAIVEDQRWMRDSIAGLDLRLGATAEALAAHHHHR